MTETVAGGQLSPDVAPVAAEPASPTGPRWAWWEPWAVFLPALFLRLINIGALRLFIEDAELMVPTGQNYARFGLLAPDNWFTQPATHLLRYAGSLVLPDSSIGWAMPSALFGAGLVPLTYVIARRLFPHRFVALSAALLVALDPTSLNFARGTTQDIPASFFMMLGIYCFLNALNDRRWGWWAATGLAMGLAGSTRWWALLVLLLMIAVAVYYRARGTRDVLADAVSYLCILPTAVYAACYLPWMSRGYSLPEWISLQSDAFAYQTVEQSGVAVSVPLLAGPLRWFVSFVVAGRAGSVPHGFSLTMNNPVLWCLFLPASAFLLWRALSRKQPGAAIVAGSMLALYAFFATSPRPIMLYSALAIVPLGFLSVSYAADRLLGKRAWAFLAAAALWCLYLLPMTCGLPVPEAAYGWLLALAGLS